MPLPPPRDDEVDPLPPPDGDAGDESDREPQPDAADLDDAATSAGLDDATGEDDPVEPDDLETDESETGWLDEPPDAPALDLGDTGLTDFVAADPIEDLDEPGVGDDDFGLGGGPERVDLDAGEEGPTDADEELRDADLPDLDADDEGDTPDAALLDAGFGGDDRLGVPWAYAPWERVGAPLPLASAQAVACAGPGAIVAGRTESGAAELLRVDLEGTSSVLGAQGLPVARVRAMRVAPGGALVAELEAGEALVSLDGGASFSPDESPRRAGQAHDDPPGARIPLLRADLGLATAWAARGGGVLRATHEREWTPHPWGGAVTALALLGRAGALLAATYVEGDDTTALVHLDAAGTATVVARLGATRGDADSDGRVHALAFDDAHGVVWVAGGFGLVAFAVPAP